MRKALLVCLLAMCGSASAQLVLPICSVNLACPGFPLGSVQAPVDANGWRNFKLVLTANVTQFSFIGTPPPSQASVSVIFTQDATGGRTVTFLANITNACTIATGANVTTVCQFEFDGTTGIWIGVAGSSSAVGVPSNAHFADHPSDPLLSPVGGETLTAFSSVVKSGATYHMYYQYNISGNSNIGHATSPDGVTWTKDSVNNPVLAPSGGGNWDSTAIGTPTVWIENGTWFMLYRGTTAGLGGLATSTNGTTWTRTPNNTCASPSNVGNGCVIDKDMTPGDGLLVEPFGVIKVGSTYFCGVDITGGPTRSAGVATSTDLLHWTKDPANPLFTGGRYDQAFFKLGNYYYDIVPHYLAGAITTSELELYRSSTMPFYPSARTYMGVLKQDGVVNSGGAGNWNTFALDTPFILTDDISRSTFNLTNGDLWLYYAGTADAAHTNFFTGLAIAGQGIQVTAETFPALPGGGVITGPILLQGTNGYIQLNSANGVWLNNASAFVFWTGRAQLSSPADGRFLIQNNAGSQNVYISTIAPASCAVTGGGTGATCALEAKSSDSKGRIVITAGTTAATSGTFTLTYSTALGTTSTVCSFTPSNGTGTWNPRASLIETTPSTASDIGNWDNNAVALTNASTYKIAYDCNGT